MKRTTPRRGSRAADIDEYLEGLEGEKRAVLEKLRDTIRRQIATIEECISYGIPAFRLNGEVVAGFAATAKGCSYFPFSGSTLRSLADDLDGYEMSKSSLHFDAVQGLPSALVRKLLRTRIAETKAHK